MMKVIDAVDPGAAPAVRAEQRFEGALGLAARAIERKCLAIENKRQLAVIGNEAVIAEDMRLDENLGLDETLGLDENLGLDRRR